MKEATGELNMTVVTVVAIAAVGAFFYAFVWPSIRASITAGTKCANATCDQSKCKPSGTKMVCSGCTYMNEDGTVAKDTITCSYENGKTQNAGGTGGIVYDLIIK